MENSIQTKVNKIGRAGRIVSIVLIVLLSIGALSLVLGGIACALLPNAVEVVLRPVIDVKVDKTLMDRGGWELTEEALHEANLKVNGDGVTLTRTDEGLLVHLDPNEAGDATYGIRDVRKVIWVGLVSVASAIVFMVMFLQLCKAFQTCRTPFDEPVIQRMTAFAWALIICAVVSCIAQASVGALLTGWQHMNFSLNLAPVFTALIVFFLCMIFRYGAQLQQEADETL